MKNIFSSKSPSIAVLPNRPFPTQKETASFTSEGIEYVLIEFSSYNRNRKRSMSVTISTCNQICNAPTNQSSAKMLFSFPKQSRFLKRKTLLYSFPHPAAIASMTSRAPSPPEGQVSAMDISMTSLASLLPPRPLTPTTSITLQIRSTALPSERAERG